MKKVLIVNRINTDNYGDRLIGESMKQLFEDGNIKVLQADYIFCPDKAGALTKKAQRALRLVKKAAYIPWCMWKAGRADAVIFGGGRASFPERSLLFFAS